MTLTGISIPFEGQSDRESNRTCGAAALSMVYRSLVPSRNAHALDERAERRGRGGDRRSRQDGAPGGSERRKGPRRLADVTQSDIWPRVSKPNRFGSVACTTHLMVKDALSRGLSAVAIQAQHPLQALLACQANGIRAILNHRLKIDSPAGHYSVLVGVDANGVTVHDPFEGPHRAISHGELLELWQPRYENSEIVGNMLIGIAYQPPQMEKCSACSIPMPREVPCPKCGSQVPLAPAALLGCLGGSCIRRNWRHLCCPNCDFTWSFAAEAPSPAPEARDGLWDLGPLFAQLDKFRAAVLAVPAAAARPDVQQQLASIEENKQKLRLAEQEELARQKQAAETSKAEDEKLAQEEAEIQKAQEAATKPAPPIDGSALGDALVKDLGIVK